MSATSVRRFFGSTVLAGLMLAIANSAPALAQGTSDAPGEARPGEAAASPAPQPARQPTLDELLGLTPETPERKAAEEKDQPQAADPSRRALERRLSATEIAEQFEEAVQLMGDTAERLRIARDTGIETQRLQDEIIRKLDMLIQSAQQQQQQSRSSSSSSSGSQDQQQQPAQPQTGAGAAEAGASDPDQATDLPAGQDPQMRPDVAARGAAWGNLPDRVRDALLQGNADQYSSMYQRWTEAYYRRLAEEGNR
jgi:hypothetical protein